MVLHDEDGQAVAVPDGRDEPGEGIDFLVVEAGGRLVEEKEPGPAGEGSRELDALERAEGEAGGRMLGHVLEPEEADELPRPGEDVTLFPPSAREPQRARHEAGPGPAVDADHDVLEDGEAREERQVLERPPDPPLGDPVG